MYPRSGDVLICQRMLRNGVIMSVIGVTITIVMASA